MSYNTQSIDNTDNDYLLQYVNTVHGLKSKIARISANQQDVAASLSRAAAALRSLANSSAPRSDPRFGK